MPKLLRPLSIFAICFLYAAFADSLQPTDTPKVTVRRRSKSRALRRKLLNEPCGLGAPLFWSGRTSEKSVVVAPYEDLREARRPRPTSE